MRQHDAKWRMCMCATGPTALTATVREMVITHDANLTIRVTNKDFQEYGGKSKIIFIFSQRYQYIRCKGESFSTHDKLFF